MNLFWMKDTFKSKFKRPILEAASLKNINVLNSNNSAREHSDSSYSGIGCYIKNERVPEEWISSKINENTTQLEYLENYVKYSDKTLCQTTGYGFQTCDPLEDQEKNSVISNENASEMKIKYENIQNINKLSDNLKYSEMSKHNKVVNQPENSHIKVISKLESNKLNINKIYDNKSSIKKQGNTNKIKYATLFKKKRNNNMCFCWSIPSSTKKSIHTNKSFQGVTFNELKNNKKQSNLTKYNINDNNSTYNNSKIEQSPRGCNMLNKIENQINNQNNSTPHNSVMSTSNSTTQTEINAKLNPNCHERINENNDACIQQPDKPHRPTKKLCFNLSPTNSENINETPCSCKSSTLLNDDSQQERYSEMFISNNSFLKKLIPFHHNDHSDADKHAENERFYDASQIVVSTEHACTMAALERQKTMEALEKLHTAAHLSANDAVERAKALERQKDIDQYIELEQMREHEYFLECEIQTIVERKRAMENVRVMQQKKSSGAMEAINTLHTVIKHRPVHHQPPVNSIMDSEAMKALGAVGALKSMGVIADMSQSDSHIKTPPPMNAITYGPPLPLPLPLPAANSWQCFEPNPSCPPCSIQHSCCSSKCDTNDKDRGKKQQKEKNYNNSMTKNIIGTNKNNRSKKVTFQTNHQTNDMIDKEKKRASQQQGNYNNEVFNSKANPNIGSNKSNTNKKGLQADAKLNAALFDYDFDIQTEKERAMFHTNRQICDLMDVMRPYFSGGKDDCLPRLYYEAEKPFYTGPCLTKCYSPCE